MALHVFYIEVLIFTLKFLSLISILGADVNAQTYDTESSPLHYAAEHNHAHIARILVAYGAKVYYSLSFSSKLVSHQKT